MGLLDRWRFAAVGAICVSAVVLASCELGAAGPGPATPTTPASPTMPTAAAEPPASRTPGAPGGRPTKGTVMEPKVIAFEVWQDFMPGVGRSGPPLLAVLELEVSNGAGLDAGNTSGAITITRQSGEVLLSAAKLTLKQQSDDLGMAQPGPRRLSFGIDPAQITAKLTEGETLHGTAVITLAGPRFEIALPQTTLMFTH